MAVIKPRRPEYAHLYAPPPVPPEVIRAHRVIVLVAGIVILSLADLVVTLAYLKANWMMEANPLASYIIRSTQSAWALAAFKCCTVTVCATLLLRLRRARAGEVAAWCGIGLLTVMSIMWRCYSHHFDDPEELFLAQTSMIFDEDRLGLP